MRVISCLFETWAWRGVALVYKTKKLEDLRRIVTNATNNSQSASGVQNWKFRRCHSKFKFLLNKPRIVHRSISSEVFAKLIAKQKSEDSDGFSIYAYIYACMRFNWVGKFEDKNYLRRYHISRKRLRSWILVGLRVVAHNHRADDCFYFLLYTIIVSIHIVRPTVHTMRLCT